MQASREQFTSSELATPLPGASDAHIAAVTQWWGNHMSNEFTMSPAKDDSRASSRALALQQQPRALALQQQPRAQHSELSDCDGAMRPCSEPGEPHSSALFLEQLGSVSQSMEHFEAAEYHHDRGMDRDDWAHFHVHA